MFWFEYFSVVYSVDSRKQKDCIFIYSIYRMNKSLSAPDDYSTKTRKDILNCFNYHDTVVRIRDNRFR
jgi:hypothetical protein